MKENNEELEYGMKKLNFILNKWIEKKQDYENEYLIYFPKIQEIENMTFLVFPIFKKRDKMVKVIEWQEYNMETFKFGRSKEIVNNNWFYDTIIDFESENSKKLLSTFANIYNLKRSIIKENDEQKKTNYQNLIINFINSYKSLLQSSENKDLQEIYGEKENKEKVASNVASTKIEANTAKPKKEYTAEEIFQKITSIQGISEKEYNFEWDIPDGLRFISDRTLDMVYLILEKGKCNIEEIKKKDEKIFVSFNSNVKSICYLNTNDALKKLESGECISDIPVRPFEYNKTYFAQNVCTGCKFDRCPKFYAGYILYLKNKGLLLEKLQDREKFRNETYKNDYFTFEWQNVEGALKQVPEKSFKFCMELLNRGYVHVMPSLVNGSVKIYVPFSCTDFTFINDEIDRIPSEIKKYDDWYYYTRSNKELLRFCETYTCRLDTCTPTLLGYLYFLRRNGLEQKIIEDRKYYEEHKDEIKEINEKFKQEKLQELRDKQNQSIEELRRYKNKIKNIENLIENIKVGNQKNLHMTLEGNDNKIKNECENKIINILSTTKKVKSTEYRRISLQNLAAENTYLCTGRTDANGNRQPIYDATVFKTMEPAKVFILTGIKEFVDDYKLYKDIGQSEYKEVRNKQFEHMVDMLTDLSAENYIILDSTEEEVNELMELNPKLKFVFQENRYKVANTSIDEMFEIYMKNIKPELVEKVRKNEREVKNRFVEYVSLNKEFVPFSEVELANYLAGYNNSKNDLVFPPNVYKKETIDESLANIIGMKSVKEKVKEFEKYALFTIKAKTLGMELQKSNLHMIFTGNPGTGKTTVARIMAKMLYDLGLIKENKLIEVERKDLVAAYIGQTAIKTSEVIEKALGGVLFIDEAYTLYSDSGNDYGKEAIATLIKAMEDKKDEIVVIFAGYRDEMFNFMKINPGIKSRIGYTFDFPDYTPTELTEIFDKKIRNMGFEVEEGVDKKVYELCEFFAGKKSFANGRFVDKLMQEVIMNHAVNGSDDTKTISVQDMPSVEELNNSNNSGKPANELIENLVGMKEIKEKLKDFESYVAFLKEAKEKELKIPNQSMHMVFAGDPGTGKTTVARIIAGILYDLGIIHENKLIEVSRKDLVAGYVGQTAMKTSDVIEKSMGGVLFIDEAYSLYSSTGNDFSHEAISTIVKAMEDNKDELVVIFAGYKDKMKDFIEMNPGIASRIGYTFDFKNYEADEYCEIFSKKVEASKMEITDEAKEEIKSLMKYFYNVQNIGNGRFVDRVFQETLLKHAKNSNRITEKIVKEEIPNIQEMTKIVFNGDNMIDPSKISKEAKRKTAIHEVGHATLRYLLYKTPQIKKIMINAEGTGTLGYVQYENEVTQYTYKKSELLDRIKVLLAGMAAEKVYIGEFANGNSSDLEHATNIAKNMVTQFGMSDLGYGQILNPDTKLSETIQVEINKILDGCFEDVIKIINENKKKMTNVVDYLMEKTEINEEEFIKVFENKDGANNNVSNVKNTNTERSKNKESNASNTNIEKSKNKESNASNVKNANIERSKNKENNANKAVNTKKANNTSKANKLNNNNKE